VAAHRLTGFSSMDTLSVSTPRRKPTAGAPPDGFLIDGHETDLERADRQVRGAPPDGFLIDGHWPISLHLLRQLLAHRLTGFSSMDT